MLQHWEDREDSREAWLKAGRPVEHNASFEGTMVGIGCLLSLLAYAWLLFG